MESHDSEEVDLPPFSSSRIHRERKDEKYRDLDFSSNSSNDIVPIRKKENENNIQNYFPSEVGASACENNNQVNQVIVKNNAETKTICENDLKIISSTSAIIWNFFIRNEKDNATCNICSTKRNTPTGTTTTLKNHLKKHSSAYQEYLRLTTLKENKIKEKRKRTNEESENSKEHTSLKSLFKNTSLDPSNKHAREITKAIALFICKGLQSFSVVEEEGFIYLLHVLEPRYKIPAEVLFHAPSFLIYTRLYEMIF